MPRSKLELLNCAERAAEYISAGSDENSTTFISFIEDMIRVVYEQKDADERNPASLYRILYNVKNSNMEVLGGGRRLRQSYINFVDGFLRISKVSGEYRPANKEFADLSLDELAYVFGWIRRLAKARAETMRQGDIDRIDNRTSQRRSGRYVEESHSSKRQKRGRADKGRNGEGPFNTQMLEQLGKWKKSQKGRK
ncbi:MAG: hypothetical protein GX094_06665 [Clostridiales bacterium]|jgi:hypothetical protein|nr:hypothetical protein [Clostridiales bacterium]